MTRMVTTISNRTVIEQIKDGGGLVSRLASRGLNRLTDNKV
jgi:hypothetical protein